MGIGFYIGRFIGIAFFIFSLLFGVLFLIQGTKIDLTGVDKKDKAESD